MPGELHHIGEGRGEPDPLRGPPRRLAVILAADIAGYSRLMGIDEEGTHARVMRLRRELVDPTIAEHHGRVVKNTGDGFLAMFDSPVEAVRCAVVIQQSMIGRNAALPQPQWILYRIGVNLGDVLVEPDDIYGDGVNIAARLEGIAQPGAVYISGGVYEQIKNKLVCGYQSLGDHKVKNITDPISVYRVLPDPAAMRRAGPVRWPAALLVALLLLALGAVGYRYLAPRSPAPPQSLAIRLPSAAAPSAAPVPATGSGTSAPGPVVPVMVSLPGGSFLMGSSDDPSEKPVHRVAVRPFAIGKYPVTVREWQACAAAKACAYQASGAGDLPVTDVSWMDAQEYVGWLTRTTGQLYRLPSEAEWEYAARGGTATRFWWGDRVTPGMANCRGCGDPYDAHLPVRAGAFLPNPFGLYDMGGGVAQWVADCYFRDHDGAPADGSPRIGGDCFTRVLKGGSWRNDPSYVRPASRDQYDAGVRYPTHGFRVARSP